MIKVSTPSGVLTLHTHDNPERVVRETPEEAALERDEWRSWLARCSSGERLLLSWLGEGAWCAEIADRLIIAGGTTAGSDRLWISPLHVARLGRPLSNRR